MRRRRLSRRHGGRAGGCVLMGLTLLLAAAACLLLQPPRARDVAALFAFSTPEAARSEVLSLPARGWYLVESDARAVAACETLLEAELVRERYGPLAGVRYLETKAVDLRVTASPAQLDALAHSAQALEDAFAALQTIAGLEAQEAAAAAEALRTRLESVCQALDGALVGTDHPVVRGLAGLVYSAREAARTLAENAEAGAAEEASAALALQYEAFTAYLLTQG